MKVLIYAYLRNIYSSRKIEQALKENIHFMWLSGGAKPDHNTIADFRSKRLKEHLKTIFNQVVVLLEKEGALNLRESILDGTKIEANANRYTFVWGKSVRNHKANIKKQLKELWKNVEKVYKDEEEQPNEPEFEELSPDKVSQTIDQINEALEGKEVSKKVRNKLRYGKKIWSKNMAKYEKQEKILNGRNSYSKTDEDATFMRDKDDHLNKGQLKPNYNLQASTDNQYITHYSLGQTPADTSTLKEHLKEYKKSYGKMPTCITADAGYGSEENYEYLEKHKIEPYVKYNYFHKEQTSKKHRDNPFLPDNLHYNKETDTYYCPMGQPMRGVGNKENTTANGYEQKLTLYQAKNCKGCPMRGPCYKSTGNRIIQRNHNLIRHRKKVKELLLSKEGTLKRKKRWKVEAVFGNIKQNKGFRRFMLRGLEKVSIETGLIAIAHNLNRFSLANAG